MPSEKTQREKFEEAARGLETDDREAAFNDKLRQIVKASELADKKRNSKNNKPS